MSTPTLLSAYNDLYYQIISMNPATVNIKQVPALSTVQSFASCKDIYSCSQALYQVSGQTYTTPALHALKAFHLLLAVVWDVVYNPYAVLLDFEFPVGTTNYSNFQFFVNKLVSDGVSSIAADAASLELLVSSYISVCASSGCPNQLATLPKLHDMATTLNNIITTLLSAPA